jgi:N-acetylglucosaminyldiphosphoundecaprenol N-acetyl-beta-D-mannosaminyltransferase
MNKNKINILGVLFNNMTMDSLIGEVQKVVEKDQKYLLALSNPEFILEARKNANMMEYLNTIDINVADGMGVVLASKIIEQPLKERITGTDFFPRLVKLSQEKFFRLYFLGGKPDVAKIAKEKLETQYPGCEIVGVQDGYFGAEMEESIIEDINSKHTHILMVCLGNPRQEEWITKHKDKLNCNLIFGNGGALDYVADEVRRAPMWMQKGGLEWLFRLSQDFTITRVKRQLKLLKFIWLLIKLKIFYKEQQ